MSRIKNLKSDPNNNIDIVKIISLFCPKNKESKYVDTLFRLLKSNVMKDEDMRRMTISELSNLTDKPESDFYDLSFFELRFARDILYAYENFNNIKSFLSFCEYNERNLISKNDLSRYKNFQEIMLANSLAEINQMSKLLEKQITVIYEDNDWLIMKPLTHLASMKYGSSTKWCTTQKNDPEYFFSRSKEGVLIYSINKITGLKVATYALLYDRKKISFWDQMGTRVDSYLTTLPNHILKVIFEHIMSVEKTNHDYLTDEMKKETEAYMNSFREQVPHKLKGAGYAVDRGVKFDVEVTNNDLF